WQGNAPALRATRHRPHHAQARARRSKVAQSLRPQTVRFPNRPSADATNQRFCSLAFVSRRAFLQQCNDAFCVARAIDFVPITLNEEWLPVYGLFERDTGGIGFFNTRRDYVGKIDS